MIVFGLSLTLNLYLSSCKKEEIPTLSTSSVTDISNTSASSGGNITSDGNSSVTSRGVCWSQNANPTISDTKTIDGSGTGQFVSLLNNLSAGSKYHVRAYATNDIGSAYGAELTFTTLALLPTVITLDVTGITRTDANGGGNITSDGGSAVTARGICWSTSTNPTIDGLHTNNGSGLGIYTGILAFLTPGTKYFVKAFATNSVGTGYGNEVIFNTIPYELANLFTYPAISLNENIATSGGNITSDGGSPITERGVCWSISQNPTLADSHTIDGNGIGSFSSDLRCLFDETLYYVRAYAKNSVGTAYGNQQTFTTNADPIIFNPTKAYGLISDIDGNCYKIVQIGDQIWMAENLRTSRYNDGNKIPYVTDPAEWNNLLKVINIDSFEITGAYCWYNNDSLTYDKEYGKLYNFGAAESGKLCPLGWHVPTIEELSSLCDQYRFDPTDPSGYSGKELIETSTIHWTEAIGTNSTGFSSLPGGFGGGDFFGEMGIKGYYWSSDRGGMSYGTGGRYYPLPFNVWFPPSPQLAQRDVRNGFSIRCLKDQ